MEIAKVEQETQTRQQNFTARSAEFVSTLLSLHHSFLFNTLTYENVVKTKKRLYKTILRVTRNLLMLIKSHFVHVFHHFSLSENLHRLGNLDSGFGAESGTYSTFSLSL